MMQWICSACRAPAYNDGRCGDGPVLMCGCDKGKWIDDGRGGYFDNPTGAKPIMGEPKQTHNPAPVVVVIEKRIQIKRRKTKKRRK